MRDELPVLDLAECAELTSVCECGQPRIPEERACWECLAADPALQS